MEFAFETSDGRKSLDRKIKKLIEYVNTRADSWIEIEKHKYTNQGDLERSVAQWAKETIENGIKNLASNCSVYRLN